MGDCCDGSDGVLGSIG